MNTAELLAELSRNDRIAKPTPRLSIYVTRAFMRNHLSRLRLPQTTIHCFQSSPKYESWTLQEYFILYICQTVMEVVHPTYSNNRQKFLLLFESTPQIANYCCAKNSLCTRFLKQCHTSTVYFVNYLIEYNIYP